MFVYRDKSVYFEKKRMLAMIFLFVLLSICAASLFYTPQKTKEYVHTDDIVATINKTNIKEFYNKKYNVDFLVIDLNSVKEITPHLVIKFCESGYKSYYDVWTYENDDYTKPSDIVSAITYSGSGYAVIDLKTVESVTALGIPNNIYEIVDCVEVHENKPVFSYKNGSFRVVNFVIFEILLLLCSVLFYTIDSKEKYLVNALSYAKKHVTRRNMVIVVAIIAALAVIAYSLVILSLLIKGKNIGNIIFKFDRLIFSRFVLAFGGLASFVWIITMRNEFERKAAKIFFVLVMIIGTTMILVCPFGRTMWDVDSHYNWALTASTLGIKNQTETDLLITSANMKSWVTKSFDENVERIQMLNDSYGDILDSSRGEISIAHVPAGIGIALGRMFHLPFYFVFLMGEYVNLFVYSSLCAIAINRLKSGKFILTAIALFPTNIFLACCYSYDYWVNGFLFVGVAYFVYELQNTDKNVSMKNEIIMCFSLMLACVPKQIYLPVLILPFFMPWKKIGSKVKYYTTAISSVLLLGIMLIVRSLSEINTTGDVRGGNGINPIEQVHFILNNIPTFISTLLRFMRAVLSFSYIRDAVARYANLGENRTFGSIILFMVIALAFIDKKECDSLVGNWKIKAFAISNMILVTALISTAFYLVFTPVGSSDINGVQPRYFITLLYPLAAVIGCGKRGFTSNRNYLGWVVFGIETVAVFIGMKQCMLL